MAEMDLNGILSQFRMGPTEEEKREATRMAMMRAGMGVLAANKPGPVRQPLFGLLAQGGLQGMDAYQGHLKDQMTERRAGGAMALQALQLKKALEQQQALQGLLSPQEPAGAPPAPQPAGLSPQSAGAVGAPWAAAAPVPAGPQPMSPSPGGFQPIGVDRLAKAAGAGVNIEPFLKLNAEARPDVIQTDTGKEIIYRDRKTMRELGREPKVAAPGSVPFNVSDLTPAQARAFAMSERAAGASRQIQNVNAYTPASEEAQRDFIRSTKTTYDQLKHAPVALQSIERAKALIPDAKGFMGTGGETLLEAAKFLNNRLGMSINTEGVKSAEELRTRIFFNIMDNLKKMDAQPSQLQQQIMMESLGKLGTDPNALPAVLDAFGDVIRGKVDLHNKEVQGAIQRGVLFPYDPLITLQNGGGSGDAMDKMPPAAQHRGRVIEDSSGKRFKSDGMIWKPL